MDQDARGWPFWNNVVSMRITHERTNMLCEECGAAVLIERHEISAGESFVREQRLVCEAAPNEHAIWQGFR